MQDLIKVSPCCGRVEKRQLQPLVWANDEDCPAGKRDALGVLLIGVHHPVQSGHLPLRVSNDGVREASGEVVVGNDILDPAMWLSTSSQLRAISLTPRFAKSLLSIC